jgi:hypothetical protein
MQKCKRINKLNNLFFIEKTIEKKKLSNNCAMSNSNTSATNNSAIGNDNTSATSNSATSNNNTSATNDNNNSNVKVII